MRARAEVSKEPNEFPPATCRDLSENGDTNQGLNITAAKETLNEGFTDVKLADRAFYDPKETLILFLIFLHGEKKKPCTSVAAIHGQSPFHQRLRGQEVNSLWPGGFKVLLPRPSVINTVVVGGQTKRCRAA